jgi:uncharacterized protein YkwD
MASISRQGRPAGLALAAIAALAALCFALLASTPALDASARGTDCGPNVNSVPGEATTKQFKQALRCLINVERASRDRRKVRNNRALAGIAHRHTKVMVGQDCFEHQCSGEAPLPTRIERSDYLQPGMRYGYGENLGCSRTPAAMMRAWMGNRFHRSNILKRKFRHIGVGGKRGTPYPPGSENCMPGRKYVTYTVIFGWRKAAG